MESLTIALVQGRRLLAKVSSQAAQAAQQWEAAVLPDMINEVEARLKAEREVQRRNPARVRPAGPSKVVSSAWQGIEVKGSKHAEGTESYRSVEIDNGTKRTRPISQRGTTNHLR